MGLDIYIRRLRKATKHDIDNNKYFSLDDGNGNYDDSDFPGWAIDKKEPHIEEYYDWDKYKQDTGIDINEYDLIAMGDFGDRAGMEFIHKTTGEKMFIEYGNIPIINKQIYIIGYDEIGYQRKGLNDKFYQDYEDNKIGYFVWTKKELERYKEEYCDDPYEYVYPNGEKSGDIIDEKEMFQHNIIDKFIEGECCVCFSW